MFDMSKRLLYMLSITEYLSSSSLISAILALAQVWQVDVWLSRVNSSFKESIFSMHWTLLTLNLIRFTIYILYHKLYIMSKKRGLSLFLLYSCTRHTYCYTCQITSWIVIFVIFVINEMVIHFVAINDISVFHE